MLICSRTSWRNWLKRSLALNSACLLQLRRAAINLGDKSLLGRLDLPGKILKASSRGRDGQIMLDEQGVIIVTVSMQAVLCMDPSPREHEHAGQAFEPVHIAENLQSR